MMHTKTRRRSPCGSHCATSLFGITLAAAVCGANAQQLTEIKVSYQPALYWSLPFYVASQKGWWARAGAEAGVQHLSRPACRRSPHRRRNRGTSAAPGSVPAVLGAARYNLLTIGLTNDESVGNALMASGAKADGFVENPRRSRARRSC